LTKAAASAEAAALPKQTRTIEFSISMFAFTLRSLAHFVIGFNLAMGRIPKLIQAILPAEFNFVTPDLPSNRL
jgi:hypothetical protein